LNTPVANRIEAIQRDRLHGAGWLSREAVAVMKLAAQTSEAERISDFMVDLEATARALAEARPTMVPVRNLVKHLISQTHTRIAEAHGEVSLARSIVISSADRLIRTSLEATQKVAWRACEFLGDQDTVITCSYSSTLCEVFRAARDVGKKPSAIVAESRAVSGEAYGEMTCRAFEALGIAVKLIPDAEISLHVSLANVALLGADAILRDGSVINGTPSLQLAKAAKAQGIAVYSVAESSKIDLSGVLGAGLEIEPGFDRIPPEFITGIITEAGVWIPAEILSQYHPHPLSP
jgi:translation initiation factor eIF-2B subunit delta